VLKLSQSSGKSLLNIDLSDFSMNVLWDSLTAFQQRSGTMMINFVKKS